MSLESQDNVRQEREVKLSALLLGELTGVEAAEMRRAVALDPELAKLQRQLEQTIELVRDATAKPLEQSNTIVPRQLSSERREQLLRTFKTATPREFAPAQSRGLPWNVRLSIAAALIVLAGLTALMSTTRRDTATLKGKPYSLAKGGTALPESKTAAQNSFSFGYSPNGVSSLASAVQSASAVTAPAQGVAPAAPALDLPKIALRHEAGVRLDGGIGGGGFGERPQAPGGAAVENKIERESAGAVSREGPVAQRPVDASVNLAMRGDNALVPAEPATSFSVESRPLAENGPRLPGTTPLPMLGEVPQLGRFFQSTRDAKDTESFEKKAGIVSPSFDSLATTATKEKAAKLSTRVVRAETLSRPGAASSDAGRDNGRAPSQQLTAAQSLDRLAESEQRTKSLAAGRKAVEEQQKLGWEFQVNRDAGAERAGKPGPIPQPDVSTSTNVLSTFSLNVADVSFRLAAASLEKGALPDVATVRSEEFINAFDYRDPEPSTGQPVTLAWERAAYPFAQDRDVLRLSIKTAAAGRQPGRPLNLVLVLDRSGSMERADRVRIVQEALSVLGRQLQPADKLSLICFARTARLWADGVSGGDAVRSLSETANVPAEGGTNLEEALALGYDTARRHYLAGGINRVVLLTDGAANLGNVNAQALQRTVEAHRQQGIALDCFGVGWEGYNDELLQILSSHGDGRYGFLNTPEEAASTFAGQLAGALRVAAADVKVQVEFNPKRVSSFRQVGYASHQLTAEQFRNNAVDAAELGGAESGTAIYVVQVNTRGEGPIAELRVRYKVPGTTDYREQQWTVPFTGAAGSLEAAGSALRLAVAASAFSEWLVSSPFAAEVTPESLLRLLSGVPQAYSSDERPKKLEWMIRQAASLK